MILFPLEVVNVYTVVLAIKMTIRVPRMIVSTAQCVEPITTNFGSLYSSLFRPANHQSTDSSPQLIFPQPVPASTI